MRLYPASSEEALRTRKFLADWTGEGLITQAQYQHLKQETVTDLRTTNIFLRLVLFLFTVIGVVAVAALFLLASSNRTIFFLIYAAVCYATAEFAASRAHLYRHGIEEALAVCSVVSLCVGLQAAFISGGPYSAQPNGVRWVIPAAGCALSLWIWRRFGLWYLFLGAMVYVAILPGYWTSTHSAQHAMVASILAVGLVCIIAARSRHHFDYVEDEYSIAEALLWLGIYLAINLQLTPLSVRSQWFGVGTNAASEFAGPFYWATWVLTWVVPAAILVRGIRQKDRLVIGAGAIAAVLTFITNKPYLGWPRHTWDPMLLGILLTGAALLVRRWLAGGPNGIRDGFTGRRLSGKDKEWLSASSAVLGLVTPQAITPSAQTRSDDFQFGGGTSGGGGAGGDY